MSELSRTYLPNVAEIVSAERDAGDVAQAPAHDGVHVRPAERVGLVGRLDPGDVGVLAVFEDDVGATGRRVDPDELVGDDTRRDRPTRRRGSG